MILDRGPGRGKAAACVSERVKGVVRSPGEGASPMDRGAEAVWRGGMEGLEARGAEGMEGVEAGARKE